MCPAWSTDDYAVLELSSFQLMTMQQSPHIAVVTNLSPNHLDYHHTMEEYTQAKTNIFSHQCANDRAVFNLDNDITRRLGQDGQVHPHHVQPKGEAGGRGRLSPGQRHLVALTTSAAGRCCPCPMIRMPWRAQH